MCSGRTIRVSRGSIWTARKGYNKVRLYDPDIGRLSIRPQSGSRAKLVPIDICSTRFHGLTRSGCLRAQPTPRRDRLRIAWRVAVARRDAHLRCARRKERNYLVIAKNKSVRQTECLGSNLGSFADGTTFPINPARAVHTWST